MPYHYNYYAMACTGTEAAAKIFSRIIFPAGNFQDEFSGGFYQKLFKFFKKRTHISPHFSYFHNNFRKLHKMGHTKKTEDIYKLSLEYHRAYPKGKLATIPTKPHNTQQDLSLAYSPGVAAPSLEIAENPENVYQYTGKGNLVGVITNGTAVLGLGNIGAEASKPVMEGKAFLFKILAGIDAYDIEINTEDIGKFIDTVKMIAPTFGGINLEDIKSPECFEIERRLRKELDIPVMHDDQHGTAIISSAALLNAMEIAGKRMEDVRIVINGAGAAAIASADMYLKLGVRKENIIMCDSKGVINKTRDKLTEEKLRFVNETSARTLDEAITGADAFIGFSKAGVLKPEMVMKMAPSPLILALANPEPEINYDEAKAVRKDLIMGTGRSDYPNQVNNVLGFPYIFRGALDVRAREINDEMKLAAAKAIAGLAKEEVPEEILRAYNKKSMSFGPDYLIPVPLDKRLLYRVASAVAEAAVDSGVARIGYDAVKYRKYIERICRERCYVSDKIR